MSWTPASQFEIRPDGSLTGGCGFDPAFGGVDYSLQASPQLTVNDAVGNGTTTLTSVTGGFTSQMLGNGINVNGNLYQITARTNTNTITVDRATGTFTGQTAKVGGAGGAKGGVANSLLEPLEYAVTVPGQVIWVRNTNSAGVATSYTGTNGLNLSAGGSQFNYLRIEGYATVRGDGGIALFPNAPAIWTSGTYCVVNNLMIGGAFGGAVLQTGAAGQIVENCIFDSSGHANTYTLQDAGCVLFRRCQMKSAPSGGAANLRVTGGSSRYETCEFTGASGVLNISLENTGITSFIGCLINGGSYGIQLNNSNASAYLRHNVIWNCSTTGLFLNNANNDQGLIVEYNLFGANVTDIAQSVDVTGNQGAQQWVNAAFRGNMFYTTGTRYHFQPAAADDVSLSVDPFVSAGSGNFALNTTAGGGALVASMVWTNKFADGVNQATEFSGFSQSNSTATTSTVFNQAAPVIDEVTFPTAISRGLQGGATYNTVVIATSGGSEQRVGLWTRPRYRWEMNNSPKQPSEMQQIIAFFHAREGRLRGFRFRDWGDFQAASEPLVPTGSNTIQLIKSYSSGPSATVRNIYKIDASPAVTLTRNGSPFAAFSLDLTTGLVSPTADSTASITAITKATAAQVTTAAAHGFTAGQTIFFSGIAGMTQLNGTTGVVQTTPTSTTFTINVNSTSFNTYTSGGVASKFIQPSETVTWTGNFTVPVRFDTDELRVVMDDATSWSLDNVALVEIRP